MRNLLYATELNTESCTMSRRPSRLVLRSHQRMKKAFEAACESGGRIPAAVRVAVRLISSVALVDVVAQHKEESVHVCILLHYVTTRIKERQMHVVKCYAGARLEEKAVGRCGSLNTI